MSGVTIDHKLTAENLTAYHDALGEDWTPVSDLEVFALAQVHATLALVEQQRIANLLAAAALVPDVTKLMAKQNAVEGWATDSDADIHSALADGSTWRALLGSDLAEKRGLA